MSTGSITVAALQGESLDALVWRATGRDSGVVEAVLVANRGLAATAAALGEGTPVLIPTDILTLAATPVVNQIVQLWD